jgi:glycosyltransferase involved in cell wall biosynthesis
LKDYKCIFLTTYLPAEEYLALLKGSDIFVNMRKSDQLVASMIEALYTGRIVITGKWLPYSSFIAKKLKIEEINDVSELSYELQEIFNNFEKNKICFKQNPNKIINIFNNKNLINQYCEIFQQ